VWVKADFQRELHFPTQLLGRAVQVDPIKPALQAPGPRRLNLKYDLLLSSFAFSFNLCRYSSGTSTPPSSSATASASSSAAPWARASETNWRGLYKTYTSSQWRGGIFEVRIHSSTCPQCHNLREL